MKNVLGSQTLTSTISTLEARVVDFKSQKEFAASTDFPAGE